MFLKFGSFMIVLITGDIHRSGLVTGEFGTAKFAIYFLKIFL